MAKLKLSDKIERELKRLRKSAPLDVRSFWVVHRLDNEQERPHFEVDFPFANLIDLEEPKVCEIKNNLENLSLRYAGDFLEAAISWSVQRSYLWVVLENGQALEIEHQSAPKMLGNLEARFYDVTFLSKHRKHPAKSDTSLTETLTRIANQVYGLYFKSSAYDLDDFFGNHSPFITAQDYEKGKLLGGTSSCSKRGIPIVSRRKLQAVHGVIAQTARELSVQSFADMLRSNHQNIRYLSLSLDPGTLEHARIVYNPNNLEGEKSNIILWLVKPISDSYPFINASWDVYSKETGAKLKDVR